MLFAATAHGGPDLTASVKSGLAWYYLIVCLANVGYGLYQQRSAKRPREALLWFAVGGFFFLHALLYFVANPLKLPDWMVTMPLWLRDLSDHGLARGLVTLGIGGGANTAIAGIFSFLLIVSLLLLAADAIACYAVKGRARELADTYANYLFRGLETYQRMVAWLLIITVLVLLIYGTNAITFFILSVVGFVAFLVWRVKLTRPAVAWGTLNFILLFGGWSMTDYHFRDIIVKPDNVPIVGLVFVVGFFTWFAFYKGVINDERLAQGLPPTEKEDDEKVLVWPDLVYTELICMVVVTVVLVIWSVALPAPLEQPSQPSKTPNPSKAPWYFLGLQEMLVYYDPWIAGVVLPSIIIVGLMALPYIDFNQKGNGYFTFAQREFAITTYLFGFVVLWVTLIFLGTFLRGPNWNFFGLYEARDPHKLVPLGNVNLSEYVWIHALNTVWDRPGEPPNVPRILIRESPGILIVLAYFLVLPPLLAKTVLRSFFIRMGFVRYFTLVNLILFMASLPIKMILRWTMNLKYIVAIPEYFFNI